MSSSTSSAMDVNAVISPEDVLETLMNDGTIDEIRLKIINHLKANEELKNNTITMVEQSKVLHTPGSEKQTKRELFDALRQELEPPALERASKSVWDLILGNDGLGKEINQTVERAFCRLSGCQPPLFPQEQHVSEMQTENGINNLDASSKKRNFIEIGAPVEDEIAQPSPSLPLGSDPRGVAEGDSSEAIMTQRCNRTDGKNWRCSKFCVPNERYCERHMQMRKGKSTPKTKRATDSSIPSTPNITISTNRSDDHDRRRRKTALKIDTRDTEEPEPDPPSSL